MAEKYKVFIVGLRTGAAKAEVVGNLARLFKIDPTRAERFVQPPPTLVKAGLGPKEAAQYRAAIEKAGARVKVSPDEPSPGPKAGAKSSPPPQKLAPVQTCPACGYEASDPEDPLVTAHAGDGECPRCGVVRAKYLRKEEARAAAEASLDQAKDEYASAPLPTDAGGLSARPVSRYAIAIIALALIAGAWWLISGNDEGGRGPVSAPTKTAGKTSVQPDQPEPTGQDERLLPCRLAPGQSRIFHQQGPLPFIHSTDQSSSLDVEYGLIAVPWEDHGMRGQLLSTSLRLETIDVWTRVLYKQDSSSGETIRQNLPVNLQGNIIHDYREGENETDVLIEHRHILEYRDQGLKTFEEVREAWKLPKDTDLSHFEKRPFALYWFDNTFTLDAPDEASIEAIKKESHFDQAKLDFWPKRLTFNNGEKIVEKTYSNARLVTPVVVAVKQDFKTKSLYFTVGAARESHRVTCE